MFYHITEDCELVKMSDRAYSLLLEIEELDLCDMCGKFAYKDELIEVKQNLMCKQCIKKEIITNEEELRDMGVPDNFVDKLMKMKEE